MKIVPKSNNIGYKTSQNEYQVDFDKINSVTDFVLVGRAVLKVLSWGGSFYVTSDDPEYETLKHLAKDKTN